MGLRHRQPPALPAARRAARRACAFCRGRRLPLLFDFPPDMARVPAEVNRLSNQVLVHDLRARMGQGAPATDACSAAQLLGGAAARCALAGCERGARASKAASPASTSRAATCCATARPAAAAPRDARAAPGSSIAGGGVAGLAAARALRLAGIEDFALLELEDGAGGNSRGRRASAASPARSARTTCRCRATTRPRCRTCWKSSACASASPAAGSYDERHLCHSPQERLFFRGEWQDGLLPLQGVRRRRRWRSTAASRRRSTTLRARPAVSRCRRCRRACTPGAAGAGRRRPSRAGWTARAWTIRSCAGTWTTAAATTTAPGRRRCRPGPASTTSPAATASRRPGDARAERDAVLTWPEGNGWLRSAWRAAGRPARSAGRWCRASPKAGTASRSMPSMPARGTRRALAGRALHRGAAGVRRRARGRARRRRCCASAAARLRYAPWLVANLHLRAPLADRPGAAPSWDNVRLRQRAASAMSMRGTRASTRRRGPRC